VIKRAYEFFKKKLREPRAIALAMDRLIPDVEGEGIRKADVIIEAIYEDLAAKQQIFKMLEQHARPDTILATNTSSIPLDEINKVLTQPERLVGIHFFNPVEHMQLIEIVKGKQTATLVHEQALSFVRQIDRLPLPVKSSPGFLVNRVLMPYLMESMVMLNEGIPAEVIDRAALDFGMPMGPVELADTVGLDVCLSVAKNLSKYFALSIPEQLRDKVAQGELGKKTGKGFYVYKNGKPIKHNIHYQKPTQDLADRLILRMINEAAACLREHVVENEDLLDAGMVFGAGFAPFRGGPMHYAKSFGKDKLNNLFKTLESEYGERFKADSQLELLQESA
jgi:3-hydroxyacyl-CoA dehydrogenase / enoyl-CoA hydratase / 3-hydroxybutyryl-CoA epimerase